MPANGAARLAAIGAELKVLGARGLRLELMQGLRLGAKPLIGHVHDAAIEKLPKAGGLNERVAAEKVSVSVRTGARTAVVRMTTRAPDTKDTDSGIVWHPTFGHRGKGQWAKEDIPDAAGWWSQTLANHAPDVSAELTSVLSKIEASIAAAGRV